MEKLEGHLNVKDNACFYSLFQRAERILRRLDNLT